MRAVSAACLLAAVLACPVRAQSLPPVWQRWIASLQSQGYQVAQGSALEFTSAYCQQSIFPYFHSCFSGDPNDPYIVPLPPVGKGYVDPYFGPSAGFVDSSGVVVGEVYHAAIKEAVLVIVTLPPAAAYFSYQSYLFTRRASVYRSVEQLSPDPGRAELFASFNNSVDNVTIRRRSGLGFGQGTVAFITTPNSSLAADLSSSFSGVGGDPKDLFTDRMGSNLNVGLGQNNDDFSSVIRYAAPQDATAGNSWRADAATNVQVFRVVQPRGQASATYGDTPLANKSYYKNEADQAGYQNELSQILRNWLAGQESDNTVAVYPTLSSEKVDSSGVLLSGDIGPYCIAHGTNCGADSQDTDAYKSADVGPLPAGRLFIVDGVNHAVTANATFFSVSASDHKTGTGIAGVLQTNRHAAGFATGTLTGSAAEVLQSLGLYQQASAGLQNDLPNLYVQLFTRPCSDTAVYCLQPYTTTLQPADLPYSHHVVMTERAYVLPQSPNGANPDDLLNPSVIY